MIELSEGHRGRSPTRPRTGGDPADAFDVVLPRCRATASAASPTPARVGDRADRRGLGGADGPARLSALWRGLGQRLGDVGHGQPRPAGPGARGREPPGPAAGRLPGPAADDLTEAERETLASLQRAAEWDSGYSREHATRPQTIGYALTDSPAALCAWIIEKYWAWTDHGGHLENVLTRDELLDNLMLYWLPRTGASAARLYWESVGRVNEWIGGGGGRPGHRPGRLLDLPRGVAAAVPAVGAAAFPGHPLLGVNRPGAAVRGL